MTDAYEFFGTAGFEFWETGGGCTAFGRNLDDGKSYVLITDADGGVHPTDPSEPVMVGFYDDDKNYDGIYAEVVGWEAAVETLNTMIKENVQ